MKFKNGEITIEKIESLIQEAIQQTLDRTKVDYNEKQRPNIRKSKPYRKNKRKFISWFDDEFEEKYTKLYKLSSENDKKQSMNPYQIKKLSEI